MTWRNYQFYCSISVPSYGMITLIESTRGNEFRVSISDNTLKKYYYTWNSSSYLVLTRQGAQDYIDNFINRVQKLKVFI